MMSEKCYTIDEWGKLLGFTVLDPDGFDRTDRNLNNRLFTKKEFLQNCGRSTISDVRRYRECLKEIIS